MSSSYARVTPRARVGTTGINEEMDVEPGAGVWISPPDRVAAVTVAVHIPPEESASYNIEICCNRPETIGDDGTGGYWDDVFGTAQTEDQVIMLANAVTGIRVKCNAADSTINVAFCG